LRARGLEVVYADYPNASRSGAGLFGKIHLAFEHILDRHPDLVAIHRGSAKLILCEIDIPAAIQEVLTYKSSLYRSASSMLLDRIGGLCGVELDRLVLVFAPTGFRPMRAKDAIPPMDAIVMFDGNGELRFYPEDQFPLN
jgi:hypothetical protein